MWTWSISSVEQQHGRAEARERHRLLEFGRGTVLEQLETDPVDPTPRREDQETSFHRELMAVGLELVERSVRDGVASLAQSRKHRLEHRVGGRFGEQTQVRRQERALARPGEEEIGDRVDHLGRVTKAFEARFEFGQEVVRDPAQRRPDELLARSVVVQDHPLVHAGRVGDSLERGPGVAVLAEAAGQLRARNNWASIAREAIYGEPPQTELGRLEAEWAGMGRGAVG